jgi:hypothetical protein
MTGLNRQDAAEQQADEQDPVDSPYLVSHRPRVAEPGRDRDRREHREDNRNGRDQDRAPGGNGQPRTACAAADARSTTRKLLLPEGNRCFATPWTAISFHAMPSPK